MESMAGKCFYHPLQYVVLLNESNTRLARVRQLKEFRIRNNVCNNVCFSNIGFGTGFGRPLKAQVRALSALRALARSGLKIGRIGKDYVSNSHVYFFGDFYSRSSFRNLVNINACFYYVAEDVTLIPTDSTRRKGGRRGRRL
jgi:hypothetical protein